jgi:nicotinamide-nucleotide amidase
MAKARNEAAAATGIKKIENMIRKRLKPYIYGVDKETLADNVVAALTKRKKTIAAAESCTGGLLANFITNVPGASGVFMEGVISYDNGSKVKNLGVKPETLKKYGAVSAQVAGEMAAGIQKRAQTDIGIGVTGIAGPAGATKTKPVGLVYIAIALSFPRKRESIVCKRFNFLGSRAEIKHQASQAALNMIRCSLSPLGRGSW